jgi:hypothetical protein
MALWLIYCWRDSLVEDHPTYSLEIERLAQESQAEGHEVHVEQLDYTTDKRLWDQMVDKIRELMTTSDLSTSDICALFVSRSLLPGDVYLEEDAYALEHPFPRGTLPCIGWVYV